MNYDSDQDFDREPGGCDGWENDAHERWCKRQLKLQELKEKLEKVKEGKRIEIELLANQIRLINRKIALIDKEISTENVEVFEVS